jgi:hypothetical protein
MVKLSTLCDTLKRLTACETRIEYLRDALARAQQLSAVDQTPVDGQPGVFKDERVVKVLDEDIFKKAIMAQLSRCIQERELHLEMMKAWRIDLDV